MMLDVFSQVSLTSNLNDGSQKLFFTSNSLFLVWISLKLNRLYFKQSEGHVGASVDKPATDEPSSGDAKNETPATVSSDAAGGDVSSEPSPKKAKVEVMNISDRVFGSN